MSLGLTARVAPDFAQQKIARRERKRTGRNEEQKRRQVGRSIQKLPGEGNCRTGADCAREDGEQNEQPKADPKREIALRWRRR